MRIGLAVNQKRLNRTASRDRYSIDINKCLGVAENLIKLEGPGSTITGEPGDLTVLNRTAIHLNLVNWLGRIGVIVDGCGRADFNRLSLACKRCSSGPGQNECFAKRSKGSSFRESA